MKRPPLPADLEVGIPNDRTPGVIIRRVRPNFYLVAWKGHEIEMHRAHLSVKVKGIWRKA